MIPTGEEAHRSPRRVALLTILPMVVAVLSLAATVTTILVLGRSTRAIREEIIQVVEPARNRLYELQHLLALDEAEQRGGTPPPLLERALPERRTVQQRALRIVAEMRPLAYELGPEAVEAQAQLQGHLLRWQEEGGGANPSYIAVLIAAQRLHGIFNEETRERRAVVSRYERLENGLIAGFVLLALGSLVILARIGTRQRRLVAEARALAAESERRREEIKRVAEEKSQFIRGVTHDLKNPLGAIDAYAQLMEAEIEGTLTPTERHYVGRIRNAVQEVLHTIGDLLELARIEAGHIPVERRATDSGPLVREVVEDYRASAEAAGLELSVRIPEELPRLHTDARRVREVLGNLISNAVKYTPSGGRVSVRVDHADDAHRDLGECITVAVLDTGPGIAPELHETVFEEFRRGETGDAAGAGLGLAISRRIARLLGGEITLDSTPGEGSVFTLWLPLRAPALLPGSGSRE